VAEDGVPGLGGCFGTVFCGFAVAAEGVAGREEHCVGGFGLLLSWKRFAGATGLFRRPFGSVLIALVFGAESGSSDRLFTPAAALLGVNLKRSAGFGGFRATVAEVAGLGVLDCGVGGGWPPTEDSKELNDCACESVCYQATPFEQASYIPSSSQILISALGCGWRRS
jgi:hypothetical protein